MHIGIILKGYDSVVALPTCFFMLSQRASNNKSYFFKSLQGIRLRVYRYPYNKHGVDVHR